MCGAVKRLVAVLPCDKIQGVVVGRNGGHKLQSTSGIDVLRSTSEL